MPPSQPRVSPHSREWPNMVRLSFSAFISHFPSARLFPGTRRGRARSIVDPPHGNTFNQGSALKRGGLSNPAPAILIGGGVRFSFPSPALGERHHYSLARRLVASARVCGLCACKRGGIRHHRGVLSLAQ